MSDTALNPERILDAAEEGLRRYGPAKTTVADGARALGVSHGSVYQHFPSKAALRDEVARRWLHRVAAPLAVIAAEPGPALPRLRRWLDQLVTAKRCLQAEDPELFATYVRLVGESRQALRAHVAALTSQLATVLADGAARGEIDVADPPTTARAVFDATARFHNPANAASWADPALDAAYEGVWALLEAALRRR